MTAVAGPTQRRVLVLRALGLGDLLTALPALRGLRAAHRGHQRVLAAPAWLAPLALLSGAVDKVLDTPALDAAAPTALRWCGPAPELAVNLHGRGPQSTDLLRALQPARLVSYGVSSHWRPDEREVDRWCRLLAEAGIDCQPGVLALPLPAAAGPVGLTVVHPGAGTGSRRWPAGRFAALARALVERGHRVVLTGSAGEAELAGSVAAAARLPEGASLAGRTSLLELAALVGRARLVVSGDTGVGHLATAYGTPSVLLFGPVSPSVWGPPAGASQHRVLWGGRTSEPFSNMPAPALLAVGVPDVLASVDGLVAGVSS